MTELEQNVVLNVKLGCEFIDICPDVAQLKENISNPDILNQYTELCRGVGHESCSLYRKFSREEAKNGA